MLINQAQSLSHTYYLMGFWRGRKFFDSVASLTQQMETWSREHHHATERMWTALSNMQHGVNRWEHRP